MRSTFPTRVGLVGACLAALLAVSAAPSLAQQSDFSLGFQASTPATDSGLKLHIVYRDPADPNGKPSPIRHLVIVTPPGTRFNVDAVPRCEASDQEIQAQGPAACPPASQVGAGTLTAITGFGPPVDPFTGRVTIFNDGQGWVEVVDEHQSGATVADDRIHVSGSTLTGNPPATPGGPPDGQTAVRAIDFDFPAASHYITTPPSCPRTGTWTTTATFTFADGTTQHARSEARCRAASSGAGPVMRLGASPRRVHTGWNRIRFRVSSAAVRCRAGATIRFAGHRTRSDARGRASIRVHLERAGIHRAAATKPGCVGAKRGLVVRGGAGG